MEWARILAYITGTVDQELLLRELAVQLPEEMAPASIAKMANRTTCGKR
jgi:hypothetical protein